MVYPDVCQVMVLFIWGKMTSLSLCFNCMTASHLLINEKAGRFGYHDSVQIQRASFMTRKKQQMMAEFKHSQLGGGFKYFLFSSLFGEDSHFDSYFSNGLKPPTRQAVFPLGLFTRDSHGECAMGRASFLK